MSLEGKAAAAEKGPLISLGEGVSVGADVASRELESMAGAALLGDPARTGMCVCGWKGTGAAMLVGTGGSVTGGGGGSVTFFGRGEDLPGAAKAERVGLR